MKMSIFSKYSPFFQTDNQIEQIADLHELILLEDELQELKLKYRIKEKTPIWKCIVNTLVERCREPKLVDKRSYCLFAALGGIFGLHYFFVGKKVQGLFYLLTCVTGASIAMSFFDLFGALCKKSDEENRILI